MAALLFVAKPFIGFKLEPSLHSSSTPNSVLVKAFSKRKPEDLAEASKRKAAIVRLLSNPPAKLVVSIFSLLGLLALSLAEASRFKSYHYSDDQLSTSRLLYLLIGRLTI